MSAFNTSGFNVTRFNEGQQIDVANYVPNPSRTVIVAYDRSVDVEAENREVKA